MSAPIEHKGLKGGLLTYRTIRGCESVTTVKVSTGMKVLEV